MKENLMGLFIKECKAQISSTVHLDDTKFISVHQDMVMEPLAQDKE
jgi:hypothetical protein